MSSVLSQWAANLRIAYDRHRAVEVLSKLSDLQLRDIGIERNAIEEHVSYGMPWQGRTTYAARPASASLQGCG